MRVLPEAALLAPYISPSRTMVGIPAQLHALKCFGTPSVCNAMASAAQHVPCAYLLAQIRCRHERLSGQDPGCACRLAEAIDPGRGDFHLRRRVICSDWLVAEPHPQR